MICPGEKVWGILYELSNEDMEKLDRYEGHPNVYKRRQLTVYKKIENLYDNNINILNSKEFVNTEAEIYEVVNKKLNLSPKWNYLSPILGAALNNNFPISYQKTLHQFAEKNYEKLDIIFNQFIVLEDLIKKEKFPSEVKKQKEWGGAYLVITGNTERKNQLNIDKPFDIVILTKHWEKLSWLVERIYKLLGGNLEDMRLAADKYHKKYPDEEKAIGICLAVLYAAFKANINDGLTLKS